MSTHGRGAGEIHPPHPFTVKYRDDLDKLVQGGCANPECRDPHHMDPMFLHSRCHPGFGLWASYSRRTGRVTLTCTRCQAIICMLPIAWREETQLPGTGT